jgi:UDP-N-acetylmuramyl pentapeptide phosphotransferase/UDP-N-acetylglucosamine-1-phosphate transferase
MLSAALVFVICAIGAALTTRLAIAYAHLAAMQDLPGARRMHSTPIARGAGIGFVAIIGALLLAFGYTLGWEDRTGRWAIATAVALAIVAAVSWVDDRRGLPALPRLIAHLIAAGILVCAILPAWLWLPAGLAIAATINFWNFIDGINGMAGLQAALAAALLAGLALYAGEFLTAILAAGIAGSVLGFLPSNFPKPRAFMGDVGSATLGLIVAALALAPGASSTAAPVAVSVMALASAVLLDTGLTLLWRVSRRRRRFWYTAHREHLYQWMARTGMSHAQVTLLYAAWTIGPALAVAVLAQREPSLAVPMLAGLYLIGAALWSYCRPRVLARARR